MVHRLAAALAVMMVSAAAAQPPVLGPGLNEIEVELPSALRTMASQGKSTAVTHALVTIAIPGSSETPSDPFVLVVSATSDASHRSSRELLRLYAPPALASRWIVVAADPGQPVQAEEDDVALRISLNTVALAVLRRYWPQAEGAPLAFAGFSGGAKCAAWLAAAFARQERRVVGLYLAGINQETVVEAAKHFEVLDDRFRDIRIYLHAREADTIATVADHRRIENRLKRSGFGHVRLVTRPGTHEPTAEALPAALEWFREAAAPR